MTGTTEIIDAIALAVADRVQPRFPVAIDLWSVDEISAWLKMSTSHVQQRILPVPGFPQAIRLPYDGKKSHPRWKAAEVIAWVSKHQEKRVA